ncbi:hypothetical protein PO002_41945 [Cupriavidus necator]|uniref:hypothetical protein n=1 Tax=Cupriavidus necator TaxID=106590 RepID=UPI0039C3D1D3
MGYRMTRLGMTGLAALLSAGTWAAPVPCGPDSKATNQVYAVHGEGHWLRAEPRADASKQINQKATEVLKRTEYMGIDSSTVVKEECTKNGWSRVQIVRPSWLTSHVGWVQSKVLRRRQYDAIGMVIFTEEDFLWDKKLSPYKKIVVAGVNSVYRENEQCGEISPETAYISPTRGTKADPVFFVTCGTPPDALNVYFSKSDVEKAKKTTTFPQVDMAKGIAVCQDYARSHTKPHNTVELAQTPNLKVVNQPYRRASISASFTAKNEANTDVQYTVRCLVGESGLMDADVSLASRQSERIPRR